MKSMFREHIIPAIIVVLVSTFVIGSTTAFIAIANVIKDQVPEYQVECIHGYTFLKSNIDRSKITQIIDDNGKGIVCGGVE